MVSTSLKQQLQNNYLPEFVRSADLQATSDLLDHSQHSDKPLRQFECTLTYENLGPHYVPNPKQGARVYKKQYKFTKI